MRSAMMGHATVRVQVWVSVDEGIAGLVCYLNTIPGVWTHGSCQGTLGEGGPHPYRPQVLVTWESESVRQWLAERYDMSNDDPESSADPAQWTWAYVHPRCPAEPNGEVLKEARN